MLTREEFLRRRRSGIGGSDIAAVCGLSPWRSPLDVYCDKIGEGAVEEEPMPTGSRRALYWGAVLEEPIAKAYSLVTGRRVVRYSRLLRNPAAPWEIGDIDRLVIDDGAKIAAKPRGEIICRRGLEIKTARVRGDEWGEEGSDKIPLWYLAQVQWYMALAPSIEVFDVVVLFGGSDLAIFTVDREPVLIEMLAEVGARFWKDHVERRVPPPPRTVEEAARLFPVPEIPTITASADLEQRIRDLAELAARRRAAEKAEEQMKDLVASRMANAEAAQSLSGEVLATFKPMKNGGRRLSVKVK